MLKPLVPKFRPDLSVRLRDIAEEQVPVKLKPMVFTSGARSAERSSFLVTDTSEYERPAGQLTLLKSLYLRNYTSELDAVFTVR